MKRMLAATLMAAVAAAYAGCGKSEPPPAGGATATPTPPTGPGAPGGPPGAPGMMPGAPGGPGMAPPGPPAAAKAEAPKAKEPEAKKPVDLSDDPFASEKPAEKGKTTPTGALGKAILKGVIPSGAGAKTKSP